MNQRRIPTMDDDMDYHDRGDIVCHPIRYDPLDGEEINVKDLKFDGEEFSGDYDSDDPDPQQNLRSRMIIPPELAQQPLKILNKNDYFQGQKSDGLSRHEDLHSRLLRPQNLVNTLRDTIEADEYYQGPCPDDVDAYPPHDNLYAQLITTQNLMNPGIMTIGRFGYYQNAYTEEMNDDIPVHEHLPTPLPGSHDMAKPQALEPTARETPGETKRKKKKNKDKNDTGNGTLDSFSQPRDHFNPNQLLAPVQQRKPSILSQPLATMSNAGQSNEEPLLLTEKEKKVKREPSFTHYRSLGAITPSEDRSSQADAAPAKSEQFATMLNFEHSVSTAKLQGPPLYISEKEKTVKREPSFSHYKSLGEIPHTYDESKQKSQSETEQASLTNVSSLLSAPSPIMFNKNQLLAAISRFERSGSTPETQGVSLFISDKEKTIKREPSFEHYPSLGDIPQTSDRSNQRHRSEAGLTSLSNASSLLKDPPPSKSNKQLAPINNTPRMTKPSWLNPLPPLGSIKKA